MNVLVSLTSYFFLCEADCLFLFKTVSSVKGKNSVRICSSENKFFSLVAVLYWRLKMKMKGVFSTKGHQKLSCLYVNTQLPIEILST